jgi:hypothetical protein
MILLTGFYHDPDPRRRGELFECIERNAANARIDEVRVFIEDATLPETISVTIPSNLSKVRLIPLGRRVTFRFLFDYANENLKGWTVVAANADIFFDETLGRLNGYDLTGKLLCLSRWDVQADGSTALFEHPSSQDAWIFQAPVPEIACDFHLGLPGCDNRLAWEAEHAGLQLFNPARTVRANHLHLTAVHRYDERQRLAGPVKSITAMALETQYPSQLGPPPQAPCAAVAFNEQMGYSIAKLDLGASSHNNDTRPFKSIPQTLIGRSFTQVVSSVVSEVEIEFLTAGKLYVLVGNDWEGHYPATAWLSKRGYKEDLALVETERGTGFEVWSLAGEAGQSFILPTQVMLVSDNLLTINGEPRSNGVERLAEKDNHPGCVFNPPGAKGHVRPRRRHLLIATRPGCGLWSMFFQVIGLIRHAERNGLEPVVYFNGATCWWSQDGYNGSRNAWEYFFEPVGQVSATELLGNDFAGLEHASLAQMQAALPDDLVMSDYVLDHVGHYDHTEAQRQEYAAIVERRIRVKGEALAKLDVTLVDALSRPATAVHYRGTDKFCESPRRSVHEYYEAIQNRVDPSHKLFVATDDAPFLDWMIGTYPDRVLYTKAARSTDGVALHFGLHRGAKQAEECLLDVLLMARCQHLVHGNSSVTNGVLVFNLTMSHDALHCRTERDKMG